LIATALSLRIANRRTSGHSGVPTIHLGDVFAPPDTDDDDDDDDDHDDDDDDDDDHDGDYDDDEVAGSDAALATTSLLHCFL
jgi:hypothetical protein